MLQEHASEINVCVFSHIASYPGVILPIKDLVQLCKSYGIPTIVDGAHALGSIRIDLQDIQPDFWFGNCHKWLGSPKSAALLYVAPQWQLEYWPQPTVIDSFADAFSDRFIWDGTRDRSAFCAITDTLAWREEIGGEDKIIDYNLELAAWGVENLVDKWGTYSLAPASMTGPMANIALPSTNTTICTQMCSAISQSGFYAGCSTLPAENSKSGETLCFVRLSAQIYIAKEDFIQVRKAVSAVLTETETVVTSSSSIELD
jgi:selenocysteine lyase/cysteine desulfurase